ncbi:peptidylprolyl isomerase [Nonomuraea sp. NPDC050556]|uniref:peptidylprolyl isomerase n=1 Tax=Nonomuraea sp. NPDC050556 TaxID=3364369 RepID=UPI0037A42984
MSGDDRQSQLAQEHKERQAKRAAEQTKGKRNTVIGAVAALVLVGGGIFAATAFANKDDAQPAAEAPVTPSASPTEDAASPSATPTAKAGPVSCSYKRDTSVPNKFVGLPGKKPNMKIKTLTVVTNHGNVVIDVDPQVTPCTLNSWEFLAKKGFYNNTKCHRLVTPETAGLSLLQCGDPLAKADGVNPTDGIATAGYTYLDENAGAVPYSKGVVFMTQPDGAEGQNNSQFAISLSDENGSLIQNAYTEIGMVSKGMEILDQIVKDGVIVNKDDITGDGGSSAPKNPVIIKRVLVK